MTTESSIERKIDDNVTSGSETEEGEPSTTVVMRNNENCVTSSSSTSFLSNGQRLTLGIVVLILVDVIWVASSELSEYIFHDENFNKPFFSTYLKTSMFLIFLSGFIFWTPWQERCRADVMSARSHNYSALAHRDEENNEDEEHDDEIIIDNNANSSGSPLSRPSFVPINYETSSGAENESDDSSRRRRSTVRFNKIAEVRQLSESEAADALFSRLSYQATVQAERLAYRISVRLSPTQTAKLALTFCLFWFLANYSYQLAISNTEAGIVNVLSSSSSLFTLLLAAFFPSVPADKFTLSKCVAVLLSFTGVIVVSLSDLKIEKTAVPFGAVFALVSAFFYATYLVFLRTKVDHEDKLDIPMFFGFVGLFNLLMLWPLFFLLDYTQLEVFEWPSRRQWLFLILNGVIGTVFSEVLWLWGCFLTSSLIATLGISLTIPLSMIADVLLKNISYSPLFYYGASPMLLSFFAVTLLSHYEGWDPLVLGLQIVKNKILGSWRRGGERKYQRVMISDIEQNESLIGINHADEFDDEDEDDEANNINRLEQV